MRGAVRDLKYRREGKAPIPWQLLCTACKSHQTTDESWASRFQMLS